MNAREIAWTMEHALGILEACGPEEILKVGVEEFARHKRVSRAEMEAEAAAFGLEIEHEVMEDVLLIRRKP